MNQIDLFSSGGEDGSPQNSQPAGIQEEKSTTEYILSSPLGKEVVVEPEILGSSPPDELTSGAPAILTPSERDICTDFGCQREMYLNTIIQMKAQILKMEIEICLLRTQPLKL